MTHYYCLLHINEKIFSLFFNLLEKISSDCNYLQFNKTVAPFKAKALLTFVMLFCSKDVVIFVIRANFFVFHRCRLFSFVLQIFTKIFSICHKTLERQRIRIRHHLITKLSHVKVKFEKQICFFHFNFGFLLQCYSVTHTHTHTHTHTNTHT